MRAVISAPTDGRATHVESPDDIERLKSLLSCPACRSHLSWGPDEASCDGCGQRYPIEDGIPVLIADRAAADQDELDHEHGHSHGTSDEHKDRQAAHFDRETAAEFETTRPHGTAPLYEWLLREKFRRAVAPLGRRLDGATALVVCGGSGMDAEFLRECGAAVVTSDISLGAAKRARERARRGGFPLLSIVADVERLPAGDAAVDLVYVHDGLHHLEHPEKGIAEMARVGRAVSITEPARAAGTRLAVKLGLALHKEESGNVVMRLRPGEISAELEGLGFRTLADGRYLMYYRHEPGRAFGLLSRRGLFPLARSSWRVGNSVLGRFGNKMTVVAERAGGLGWASQVSRELGDPSI
ncbi:MAG: methyltransferase domain-containing protein [Candidatus Limnocylindrales bacterium]